MSTNGQEPKPLSKLQAYLRELKIVLRLLRGVLVELKDVLAIITVILFFVFGVYEALSRLASRPPQSVEQSVSKPFDQANK